MAGTVDFDVETERLFPVCIEILKILGESVPPNKPSLCE